MASMLKSIMRTYEIGYKGYYCETSESYNCVVQAKDVQDALRRFAEERELELPRCEIDNWHWEDGLWWMAFRYIKEVEIQTCPHCHGTGTLRIEKNDS